jgi:hypothetical protein
VKKNVRISNKVNKYKKTYRPGTCLCAKVAIISAGGEN